MKKFSIILNVILVLFSVFFIVFSRIQVSQAQKRSELENELQYEAARILEKATADAANARDAEMKALKALEECKKLNQ